MKQLTVPDADVVIAAVQHEIRRSPESRCDHRLHGLLLVAQGVSCRQVPELLGDSPRTVAYWVRRFDEEGLAGLVDGERSGRTEEIGNHATSRCGIRMRVCDARDHCCTSRNIGQRRERCWTRLD